MNRAIIYTSLILIITISTTWAQELTGNLMGSVVDEDGISIDQVNISISSTALQGKRGIVTNSKGDFKILNLPTGNYNIRVSFVGYRTKIIENVNIGLGNTVNIEKIILKKEAIDLSEITVLGKNLYIDPSSTTYGGNLHISDYEKLPVDRDYKSAVSLLPQANTSYFGDEVNIAGATGFENKYFVDGVEVTDPLAGRDGTNLPYNFIKEIQVKGGGYQVASRSSLGGIISVVTNSGSNNFQASAFGFFTSNGFTGYEKLGLNDPTQAVFKEYDVGFSFGGPIVLDQLWYFVAYNPSFYRREVDVPSFGIYLDRTLIHSLAAKINWRSSENLSFAITATGDPTERGTVGRNIGVPPSGLTNPDSYLMDLTEGGLNLSLLGTYTIGKNIFLQGSIDRVMRHDTGEPSTDVGKNEVLFEDNQSQMWSGGPNASWDSYRFKTNFNLRGTFLFGDHILKAGFEYKENGTDNIYDYRSIVRYADSAFVEWSGRGFGTVQNRIPSIFIQDNWEISKNISAYAGIRWETQDIIGSNGENVQKISLPLQPRLGVAWNFGNDLTSKLYISAGRFSQEFGLFQSVNIHNDKGYDYGIFYVQDPRQNAAAVDTFRNYKHFIHPEFKDLRGQYFDEISLGYEKLLGNTFRLGIQGIYRTLRETIEDVYYIDEDLYRLGNPGRGIFSEWPDPKRIYSALVISFERRGSMDFNFSISYTLSRNSGNYGGLFDAFTGGEFPNTNIDFDDLNTARHYTYGLLPNDRTHVFKFSGYYNFVFGLTTGIIFTAQSGTPLSVVGKTERGGIMFEPRGSAGRTPEIWDLSMRFSYDLPFVNPYTTQLILDIFHIASQRKPVKIDQVRENWVNDNYSHNPTYGEVYRYQPPMSVRLGIEAKF